MKYGSVYTPSALSTFVAQLLVDEIGPVEGPLNILDPACGQLSLLASIYDLVGDKGSYCGIDFDSEAIEQSRLYSAEHNFQVQLIEDDFIKPQTVETSESYWVKRLGKTDVIIANPPWSSEHLYERDELAEKGFALLDGQYDGYSLFVELGIKVLAHAGYAAFILPDSFFSAAELSLRRYLTSNTEIKVIARLGEKLFPDVHRATTVVVLRANKPRGDCPVKCFRLDTDTRKSVLRGDVTLYNAYRDGMHVVSQNRFNDANFTFDIDATDRDETLLNKIMSTGYGWTTHVKFHRGVELSKSGLISVCPHCGKASAPKRSEGIGSLRQCKFCGGSFTITENNRLLIMSEKPCDGYRSILVGESIGRYDFRGARYIKTGVAGINYKDASIYEGPKLLVRKTGMGLKAVVDLNSRMVSQTIYFFSPIHDPEDSVDELYYYCALLNSRVVYFFYSKRYGENEWKSHPYLTKKILQSLPMPSFDKDDENCQSISKLSRSLNGEYNREKDMLLEEQVVKRYGLNPREVAVIREELRKLPDLEAIKEMKY